LFQSFGKDSPLLWARMPHERFCRLDGIWCGCRTGRGKERGYPPPNRSRGPSDASLSKRSLGIDIPNFCVWGYRNEVALHHFCNEYRFDPLVYVLNHPGDSDNHGPRLPIRRESRALRDLFSPGKETLLSPPVMRRWHTGGNRSSRFCRASRRSP
jgi:hypothetical protein